MGEVVHQRLTHPLRRTRQGFIARGPVKEVAGLDDAVRIVEAQLTARVFGPEGDHSQAPAQLRRPAGDLVQRTPPPGDHQACLLGDLTRQPLDQFLPGIDHPTGRRPVHHPATAVVTHQQDTRRAFDHSSTDGPVSEAVRAFGTFVPCVARRIAHPSHPTSQPAYYGYHAQRCPHPKDRPQNHPAQIP